MTPKDKMIKKVHFRSASQTLFVIDKVLEIHAFQHLTLKGWIKLN